MSPPSHRFTATVNVMPDGPPGEVASVVRRAEELGFEAAWVLDEGVVTRDVHVTLAASAGATSTIRIGTGITNPYTRHPGVTANAIATLDELSGGRAFVGIGAGGGLTLDPLAIARDRPVETVAAMVDALRLLFAGETVDADHGVVRLRGASLPHHRNGIEIWVAGRGPRMLSMAARRADGVHLSWLHRELIGEVVARIRVEGAPRVSITVPIVTSAAEHETAREQLSFRLVDSPLAVRRRLGLDDALRAALRDALAEGGTTAAAPLVRDEWVEQFALVGDDETCRAGLRELMTEHRIDEFQLPLPHVDQAADVLARRSWLTDS